MSNLETLKWIRERLTDISLAIGAYEVRKALRKLIKDVDEAIVWEEDGGRR
jgi:hypothetical protein